MGKKRCYSCGLSICLVMFAMCVDIMMINEVVYGYIRSYNDNGRQDQDQTSSPRFQALVSFSK